MPNCMVCELMGMHKVEGALRKVVYSPHGDAVKREERDEREVDVPLCQAHMGLKMDFYVDFDQRPVAYVYFPYREDQGCLRVSFKHTDDHTGYVMTSVEYGYDGCGWFDTGSDFPGLPTMTWVTFVDGKCIDIEGRRPPNIAALVDIIQSNP